jgi:hypothetical protein
MTRTRQYFYVATDAGSHPRFDQGSRRGLQAGGTAQPRARTATGPSRSNTAAASSAPSKPTLRLRTVVKNPSQARPPLAQTRSESGPHRPSERHCARPQPRRANHHERRATRHSQAVSFCRTTTASCPHCSPGKRMTRMPNIKSVASGDLWRSAVLSVRYQVWSSVAYDRSLSNTSRYPYVGHSWTFRKGRRQSKSSNVWSGDTR